MVLICGHQVASWGCFQCEVKGVHSLGGCFRTSCFHHLVVVRGGTFSKVEVAHSAGWHLPSKASSDVSPLHVCVLLGTFHGDLRINQSVIAG